MDKLLLTIIFAGAVLSGIAIAIEKRNRNNTKIKYWVPAATFVLCLGMLIKAKWFSTGMQDLAYVVMAMIAGGAGIITLAVCFVTDKLAAKKRK